MQLNFSKIERKEGNGSKWVLKCNHCNAYIVHRDQRCAKHLMDVAACPDAPSEVRSSARRHLIDGVAGGEGDEERESLAAARYCL